MSRCQPPWSYAASYPMLLPPCRFPPLSKYWTGLPGTQLPSESRRVVATCERGKFHLSLTTSVLKDLGLVTDDGTLTNKSVEVTLTVEGEDFLEEES